MDQAEVSDSQNCGNILAGVGPWAIENGLVPVAGPATPVRIHMVNTGSLAVAHVPTPQGAVEYEGEARIDGVPGTAAPIALEFLDVAGSSCGSLLPTGAVTDTLRRHRGHLHRQRHARHHRARGGSRRHRRRDAGAARSQCGAGGQGRAHPPEDGAAHESRRRDAQDRAEDVPGERAASRRLDRHRHVHSASRARGHRRVGRGERGHRLRDSGIGGGRSWRTAAKQPAGASRWSIRADSSPSTWKSKSAQSIVVRARRCCARRASSCAAMCSCPARSGAAHERCRSACSDSAKSGQTLAADLRARVGSLTAWDLKFADSASAPSRAAGRLGVLAAADARSAVADADLVISAVTAAQIGEAARSVAPHLKRDAYYFDLNSTSPAAKQAAAAVDRCGGWPIRRGRHHVADRAASRGLAHVARRRTCGGFPAAGDASSASPGAAAFSGKLGAASAAKMCRSVVVKGLEALMLESLLTARNFGVEQAVLDSLQSTVSRGRLAHATARYMISRALIHGRRRAEEMREAARTVAEAGLVAAHEQRLCRVAGVGGGSFRRRAQRRSRADARRIARCRRAGAAPC